MKEKANKRIRYKVVTYERLSYPGVLAKIKYPLNKKVSPGYLGVFLLDTLKHAEDYIKATTISHGGLVILEVETFGKGKYLSCCPMWLTAIDQYKERMKKIFAEVKKEEIYAKTHHQKPVLYPGCSFCNNVMHVWYCAKGTMVYPAVKAIT